MNHDQHSDNNSITQSVSFSDSDDDMFGNLAPAHSKPSFDTSSDQQAKILNAKMKRLIGTSFNNKSRPLASLQTPPPQASKPKTNKKINKQKQIYSEELKFQSDEQMELKQIRERSRDQKGASRTAESIKSSSGMKKNKGSNAANLSIQKQVVKQNDSLSSNKMSSHQVEGKSDQKANDGKKQQKWQKFAEMEKMLFVPVKELPILSKTSEEIRQEKREKKRVDRLMEKKLKEYKVGKVKDQASNCVFNGIEDYFN